MIWIWGLGNIIRSFCWGLMGVAQQAFGSMVSAGYVAGVCFFPKDMQSI